MKIKEPKRIKPKFRLNQIVFYKKKAGGFGEGLITDTHSTDGKIWRYLIVGKWVEEENIFNEKDF